MDFIVRLTGPFWQIPELVGMEKKQVPEMVPANLRNELLGYEKNRIQFCWNPRPLSRTELTDWVMAEPGPRLVIMNTVQSAAVIADDICRKLEENVWSTSPLRLCRRTVQKQLRWLKDAWKIRWIQTGF